jgi:hypothetical protein
MIPVRKIILSIFILYSSCALTKEVRLSGIVYRALEISFNDYLSLAGNGDMIIEVESSSGQTARHYFQYNSQVNYKQNTVKKITVYAP